MRGLLSLVRIRQGHCTFRESTRMGASMRKPTPVFRGPPCLAVVTFSLRGWRSQERGGSNPPFRTIRLGNSAQSALFPRSWQALSVSEGTT